MTQKKSRHMAWNATVAMAISALGVASLTGEPPGASHPEAGETRVFQLGEGVELPTVYIPPGTFTMGSPETEPNRKADEGPQTEVTLTRGFWMGQTPVTVEQFSRFAEMTGYATVAEREGWAHHYTPDGIVEQEGKSWRDPLFPQDADHPVVVMHWEDIMAFCDWAREVTGLEVRLPTEAEWEYACRAGTTTAYFWGAQPEGGEEYANLADQAAARAIPEWDPPDYPFDDGYVYTSPVYAFRANPWGLHDMHGNVWEWTSDWYGGPHPGGSVTNPTGAETGEYRVRRGGSWYRGLGTARSANRGRSRADFRVNNRGFRIVVTAPAEADAYPPGD